MYILQYEISDDALVISVKDGSDFEGLKRELDEKSLEISKAYQKGACEEIFIEGADFSDDELDMLEDVIYDRIEKNMSNARLGRKSPSRDILSRLEGLARPYDEEKTKRLFERATAPAARVSFRSKQAENALNEKIDNIDYAKFKTGSMRSGQKIESRGSVVVFGDVNPGAEIRAGENIIVLGRLKGTARAGMNGNNKSYVAALEFNPEQLIITNIVADFQRTAPKIKLISKQKQIIPEYAHIEEEQIFIDPIV